MSVTQDTRRESYYAVLPTLTQRQQTVLQVLRECGSLTAQEIAGELRRRGITPTDERNYAAPRLTELCNLSAVKAVGKRKCVKTGRNVTVWSAVIQQDGEDE